MEFVANCVCNIIFGLIDLGIVLIVVRLLWYIFTDFEFMSIIIAVCFGFPILAILAILLTGHIVSAITGVTYPWSNGFPIPLIIPSHLFMK